MSSVFITPTEIPDGEKLDGKTVLKFPDLEAPLSVSASESGSEDEGSVGEIDSEDESDVSVLSLQECADGVPNDVCANMMKGQEA